MKEQLHDWEADIRQKVEQHEFDFEPQAWAEMEELLEASGSGKPGKREIKGSDNGLWWKLGLSVLIGVAVITIIALWNNKTERPKKEVALSSFAIPVDEATALPAEEFIRERSATPIIPTRMVVVEKQFSTRELPEGLEALPPVRKEIPQLKLLPPPTLLPLPEQQQVEEIDWRPPPPKPKRDRRKLFPDVIERNKK